MKRTINGKRAMRPAGNHPNPTHWEALRAQKLVEHDNACACCPNDVASGYQLELHHRHYENWGCEKPEDVVILCSLCHEHITSRFRFLDDYQVEATSMAPPRPELPSVTLRPPAELRGANPVPRPPLPVERKAGEAAEKPGASSAVPRIRPF
jgi:hypothetical protein